MAKAEKPRWQYRFDNFKRAFKLLSEAMELADQRELSALEKEGVVQRFEYTWGLAWNLLADVLSAEGLVIETRAPRSVIRVAFEANLIDDGDHWMAALEARNLMAHTYDEADFEAVVEEIGKTYLGLFSALYESVAKRMSP